MYSLLEFCGEFHQTEQADRLLFVYQFQRNNSKNKLSSFAKVLCRWRQYRTLEDCLQQ